MYEPLEDAILRISSRRWDGDFPSSKFVIRLLYLAELLTELFPSISYLLFDALLLL